MLGVHFRWLRAEFQAPRGDRQFLKKSGYFGESQTSILEIFKITAME